MIGSAVRVGESCMARSRVVRGALASCNDNVAPGCARARMRSRLCDDRLQVSERRGADRRMKVAWQLPAPTSWQGTHSRRARYAMSCEGAWHVQVARRPMSPRRHGAAAPRKGAATGASFGKLVNAGTERSANGFGTRMGARPTALAPAWRNVPKYVPNLRVGPCPASREAAIAMQRPQVRHVGGRRSQAGGRSLARV